MIMDRTIVLAAALTGVLGIALIPGAAARAKIATEDADNPEDRRDLDRCRGVGLPSHVRQWLGDSIGRWEGSSLVVDTTNFTDQTSFNGSGEGLHIVERFTPVSADFLIYEVTVTDAEAWTRPWTVELPLQRIDNQENQIFEAACHEGNYAMTSVLAGARVLEAQGR